MDNGTEEYSEDPRAVLLKTLQTKKLEVEKSIKTMKDNYKGNNGYYMGDDVREEFDRAEKEISTQHYYIFLERKTQELERLENLITRILNNEEFGYCEDCGEPIGMARLMAMPEVTRCIECQRESEKAWAISKSRTASGSNWQANWEDESIDDTDFLDTPIVRKKMENVSWDDLEEIEIDDDESGNNNKSGTPPPSLNA